MAPMAGHNSRARARDMVISMLVLLVPIGLIYWFFTSNPDAKPEAVDVAPVLTVAQEQSPYPVLRPVNLPDGWVATRVAWAEDGENWIDGEPAVGNSWQVGYISPDGTYIGLQQRDRAASAFIDDLTRDGVASGTTDETAGRTWERWTSSDGRTNSLVWRDGDVAAVVAGDTGFEQLLAFAGSLTDE